MRRCMGRVGRQVPSDKAALRPPRRLSPPALTLSREEAASGFRDLGLAVRLTSHPFHDAGPVTCMNVLSASLLRSEGSFAKPCKARGDRCHGLHPMLGTLPAFCVVSILAEALALPAVRVPSSPAWDRLEGTWGPYCAAVEATSLAAQERRALCKSLAVRLHVQCSVRLSLSLSLSRCLLVTGSNLVSESCGRILSENPHLCVFLQT